MFDRFVKWLVYWIIPINATPEQVNNKLFEIGLGIGFMLGFVLIVFYIACK
jgi:hypothetical protein